jgi:hypothetical protein
LGELWKWAGQQIKMGYDSIVSIDNRRVGLVMGIPHKENLVRAQKNIMVKDAEKKSMHSTMIELWVTSIEYAIITWRTRGFLRASPETIQSWYMKGEVRAEMVKGIFEHQYAATSNSTKDYQNTIYGQAGFRVGIGSRLIIAKKTKRTRAESGMPAGREQSGKKQRQREELSEGGVQSQTHPRLTDRARERQAKVRKKELDAVKKAKEKDKKQEKVDKDKRAREREALC